MYEALLWTRLAAQLAAVKIASGSRRAAERLRDPSGQDLIEYGGILILVAAIITALLATGIVGDVKNFVSSAVDNIIGGSAQTNAKGK